ncbi:DUF6012 family protein [Enterobacter cloacae complex sp. ECC445]|uniref:DUF6012 family protein n=1 Tax=Enterobacter cloacae complex sp. ECC445 TaxID=2913213 RepID=UPI001F31FA89|nr:DUF6012 family protein [Enterobacter cloacae complex sp. ECC445]MCW1830099.1 DUF6012 family protein [Enterobacter asburiae]
MYLHLVPKILHPMGNLCTLESVSVPELSLSLTKQELTTMKPYANKSYCVGMLKGRKALNGFLVKSPRPLTEFTMESVWAIEGFGKLYYNLKTYVDDDEFDLVSHDVLLAEAYYQAGEPQGRRVHPDYADLAPVDIAPKMESRLLGEPDLVNDVWEHYAWGELVRSRKAGFRAMTMSSERLSHVRLGPENRLPQVANAIIISG